MIENTHTHTHTNIINDSYIFEICYVLLLNHLKKDIMTDWKNIHKDFNERYQQWWEEAGITYQDAKEWIAVGIHPCNCWKIKRWKNHNFTLQQVKSWIDIGLNENDAEFAAYLRQKKGHQPNQISKQALEQLKREFNIWERKNKPAQEYLDAVFSKNERNTVRELNISCKELEGHLDLREFINLSKLSCEGNQISSLNVSNCPYLEMLECFANQL